MKSKEQLIKSQWPEIMWNIVNASLFGLSTMAGAILVADINLKVVIGALVMGVVAFLARFSKYWDSQEGEYRSVPLFKII